MSIHRKKFLKLSALGGLGLLLQSKNALAQVPPTLPQKNNPPNNRPTYPIVISTWNHGMMSNAVSWEILRKGGTALDAVEQGVSVVESDPTASSVGKGGLPDREGRVTLDASIVDHNYRCGAVACLEHIANPIRVARKVMENTPHVLLVGEGAYQFAIAQGFKHENLLTESSKKAWEDWLKTSHYKPLINIENHDTIGALALDQHGNLAGACTTSGLAYKMSGRVGDSPIIGAGLFLDKEVGAACATGLGEAVLRVSGSAMVVELMRHGKTPTEACKEVVLRIIKAHPTSIKDIQVGFLALKKNGEYGSFAVQKGFNFALSVAGKHQLVDSPYHM